MIFVVFTSMVDFLLAVKEKHGEGEFRYLAGELKSGNLIDMGANVITRELEAGKVPVEFRDGPVFWEGGGLWLDA